MLAGKQLGIDPNTLNNCDKTRRNMKRCVFSLLTTGYKLRYGNYRQGYGGCYLKISKVLL